MIVDEKISSIIDELYTSLGENLLELTAKDLLGLLFFLGGNCHIRWDKC
ncbi:TPA: ABC-three component system protein [Salmonella enterica subsp. enterica serovar Virchow]